MVNFDYLNRRTHEWNMRNTSSTNSGIPSTRTINTDGFRRLNMETFRSHNGQYPSTSRYF